MHKERHFVHGTLKNIFYIKEWVPAFVGITNGKGSLWRATFLKEHS